MKLKWRDYKARPDKTFTVEQDGFVKMISARIFRVERKYKKECEENRQKSWNDTLEFLREKWKV